MIAERLGSTRTLVLVPSLSLLAQTLREWAANATQRFDYLAVCSDQTVLGEDHFAQHTAELGLPATTDPDVIAAFLRRRGRRVVFATYQSSAQIAAAHKTRTPRFDVAIADEAHRCTGRVSGEFATILDAARIRCRRRLFMTATPRFYTPRLRREAGLLNVEVASMDDENAFGPVLHRLTFGEAIARDLLSDYQVVIVAVDDETYRAWADRGDFVTRDGKKITDARTLAGQIALAKAMRKYDLHRVISFHSRVKAAREFTAEILDVIAWMPARESPGPIWSEHVSGAMSSGHRDRVLLRFRNLEPDEIGLLSNARCLAEGVDVPTLDGVAFIDPRRSTTDIIQAVGRAIRKAPDKTLGTIVLPVFIDGEDPAQALDDSTFTSVWNVLKALRAHDEKLGEELDELRRNLGTRLSPPRRPGKIKLYVPTAWVGPSFADAFNARLVERTTESWEFWYGLLMRYIAREKHAQVPLTFQENGYRLGSWVGDQRKRHKLGLLSAERAARLEAIEPWTWDALEEAWDAALARLQTYAARTGDSRVPANHVERDGHNLGQWVSTQRRIYNRGELAQDRAARLACLPQWSWHYSRDAWEIGYQRLVGFVARENHAMVADRHVETDGYRLGLWVRHQRGNYRRGKLSSQQLSRLSAIEGWTWDLDDAAFTHGLDRLRGYARRHGDTFVPNEYVEADGFKLGSWVGNRRHAYKRGRLSPARVMALEAIRGWTWSMKGDAWEKGFQRLRAFIDRHGDAHVPRLYEDDDGYRLGSWVHNQRTRYARHALTPDRVRRLQHLSGWTWVTAEARSNERWERGYQQLCRFVDRKRHAAVPIGWIDEDGFKLGQWVSIQRTRFKEGRLDPHRQQRLAEL